MTLDPAELQRLVDHDRAETAARQRRRERSLVDQLHEENRLVGVLANLHAAGWGVAIQTRNGHSHHGALDRIGEDFCTVSGQARRAHLPYAGISAVRPAPLSGSSPIAEPEPATSTDTFADLVAVLAEERSQVQIGLVGAAEPLGGTLVRAGADVLTLQTQGRDAPVCYVSLSAVVELLSERGSG